MSQPTQRINDPSWYNRRRAWLISRDGAECRWCGARSDLTIDHVQPLSAGGSNELDNLQLLCQTCNERKGSRTAHAVADALAPLKERLK